MFEPRLEALEDRTLPSFVISAPEINSAVAGASAPYVGWLSAAAAQAESAASQAHTVASAFEVAVAATVPPPAIAANRAALAPLVATNFLGQNTPAIAATEAQYTQMWAQDAVAMAGPAGASLASPSTGVVPAAADEVSAAVVALFGAHGEMYQALSSPAAAFHAQFVQALDAASGSYMSTELANPGATG